MKRFLVADVARCRCATAPVTRIEICCAEASRIAKEIACRRITWKPDPSLDVEPGVACCSRRQSQLDASILGIDVSDELTGAAHKARCDASMRSLKPLGERLKSFNR